MYWLRSSNNFLSHLFYDQSLPERSKAELIAKSINDNAYMPSCCTIDVWNGRVIPICFEKQSLKQLHFETSHETDTKVVKIMYTRHAKEADFLLAEDLTYDDITGREITRCRVYFSKRITKDMAATTYFVIKVLSMIPEAQFSDETLLRLGSEILRRYGKHLSIHSKAKFWRDQLLKSLKNDIFFRDRLMRTIGEHHSSLYRVYTEYIRQRIKHTSLIDVHYNSSSGHINYLVKMGEKPRYITTFKIKSTVSVAKRRMYIQFRGNENNSRHVQ